MFIDHAKIYVKGGDGGNGVVAVVKICTAGRTIRRRWRSGGNVIFVADEGLSTSWILNIKTF